MSWKVWGGLFLLYWLFPITNSPADPLSCAALISLRRVEVPPNYIYIVRVRRRYHNDANRSTRSTIIKGVCKYVIHYRVYDRFRYCICCSWVQHQLLFRNDSTVISSSYLRYVFDTRWGHIIRGPHRVVRTMCGKNRRGPMGASWNIIVVERVVCLGPLVSEHTRICNTVADWHGAWDETKKIHRYWFLGRSCFRKVLLACSRDCKLDWLLVCCISYFVREKKSGKIWL